MATFAGGDQPSRQQLKEYRCGKEISRIGNYLGLAMKAGMVAAGDMAAKKALQAGQAHLLVLACDISPVVAKELIFLAEQYHLPLLWWPDMHNLGLMVGKSRRGALAILDKGFAAAILKLGDITI